MSSSRETQRTLTARDARRLAIARQRLSGPRPSLDLAALMDVMRDIRCLQLDPINAVARSPLLVLWSRLGNYDRELLHHALWRERLLFEYWAHAASIVLVEDFPLHGWYMGQRANGSGWRPRTRRWLEQNQDLRRYILERLRQEGPLAPADFDGEEVSEEWHSKAWTNRRAVNQMLDCLLLEGKVLVAGRRGRTRMWDLPHRCLPSGDGLLPMTQEQAVKEALQIALRALGVGTARHIREHFTRGRYPGLELALKQLKDRQLIVPVQIVDGSERWPEQWYIHSADLPLLQQLQGGAWQPRTTLLSPFDNLICDRARTERLFNFHFRLEIYVPAAKRQYGYYVLPILYGDRFVGRIDPYFDRQRRQLQIKAVYAEPHSATDGQAARATSTAIHDLAQFLGARDIVYRGPVPHGWRAALDA